MEFGWKVYSATLLIYVVFLISLNVYAFGIPSYKESLENTTSLNSSGNTSFPGCGNEVVKNKGIESNINLIDLKRGILVWVLLNSFSCCALCLNYLKKISQTWWSSVGSIL